MTRVIEIFLAFIRIGALAFGGAYAAMPLIEQEIVDRTGWMTFTEFSDLIAIDELTPGPIIINSATFIGMKLGGIPGAIAATLGSILPACIVSIILFNLYKKYKTIPLISEMMNCLKSMSVAMILSTVLKIFLTAVFGNEIALANINVFALVMIVVAFITIKKTDVNPVIVMLGCGALSMVLSLAGIL